MNRTNIDLWVGIFVALGAAALVFLSLQVASMTSGTRGETYELKASFLDIGGLKVKAPVKSAGVVVGRVTDVSLDKDTFEAVVKIRVEERYQFPTDSIARILTSGVLGDQYIGIEPGNEMDNLQDGGTIEETKEAFVLEKLISRFVVGATSGSEKKQDDAQ
jgi:phospholipid/cholesterol/gamma-HCH transport system substrate-binding protein